MPPHLPPCCAPLQMLYERTVGSGEGVLTGLVDGVCRCAGAQHGWGCDAPKLTLPASAAVLQHATDHQNSYFAV